MKRAVDAITVYLPALHWLFFPEVMVIESYFPQTQTLSSTIVKLNLQKNQILLWCKSFYNCKVARPQVEFHLLEIIFWYHTNLTQQNNWDNAFTDILLGFDLLEVAWLTSVLERNLLWLKCHPGGEMFGKSMDLFCSRALKGRIKMSLDRWSKEIHF
jgi:hypothetical protein